MHMLHCDDEKLFEDAQALGYRLAKSINKTCVIEPKRRPLADGADGVCYDNEKRIAIKLRNKDRMSDGGTWWPKPLSWKIVSETVAHEVAHLSHPNHSKEFKALEQILIGEI